MPANRLQSVLRHLREVGGNCPANQSDRVLLAAFVASADEASFAEIVRRHGPMVFGVCRRLTGQHQSAEDAFQATFLVLAKKANRLRRPERLGPWLYGVARRVALKAQTRSARRREVAPVEMTAPHSAAVNDLRPVLDAAIAGLPDRYREPVVLCYLEGLTYAEAAERLRCPAGTIATRLSRARERLRVLLLRHGVAPAAAALTAALTAEATAVPVPDDLLRSTARWVVALASDSAAKIPTSILLLAREVTHAMTFEKLSVAAGLASLALLVAGTGVALSRTAERDEPPKPTCLPARTVEASASSKPGEQRPVPLALLRQAPPKAHLLDAGDMLGIYVEGVLGERGQIPTLFINPGSGVAPAVGFPTPVQDDGTIALPLLDPLDVRGKSIAELRTMITKSYIDNRLVAPGTRVLVCLVKPRTYRVTVVTGRPATDGRLGGRFIALDLPAYENDVLTAIAKVGADNLPPFSAVIIERGSAAAGSTAGVVMAGVEQIRIPLRVRADQPLPFTPEDIILKNGDVLTFESSNR
jgi:RNA polymerase sigma factor (sigma-70 family)